MLNLYRDLYRGFTGKHFQEQLLKRHNHVLGYTVTKLHLQRTGLVQREIAITRADLSASALRQAAARRAHGAIARRVLALALVMEGLIRSATRWCAGG